MVDGNFWRQCRQETTFSILGYVKRVLLEGQFHRFSTTIETFLQFLASF